MTHNESKLWPKGIFAWVIFNGILLFIFILILGYYYRLVPEDYFAKTSPFYPSPGERDNTIVIHFSTVII